jgi:hypothetical protein
LEVVVEKGSSPIVVAVDDNVDVEPIENLTQDEELQAVVVREVDRSCEAGALNDDLMKKRLMRTMATEMEHIIWMTYHKDWRMTKVMLPPRMKMTLLRGQVLRMMCWRTSTGLRLVPRMKVIIVWEGFRTQ